MAWTRRQWRTTGAALLCAALLAPPGNAVLLDSGDGTQNTTAPVNDPGFAHVGRRGGLTAVYLGDGWVLTANHVGMGTVTFDGETSEPLPGSAVRLANGDGTFADLLLFAVHPPPALPLLPIRTDPLSGGEGAILVGNGRDRGPATSWDPNGPPPPGPVDGWQWASSRSLRWGTNVIDGFPVDPIANTFSFYTTFDEGAPGDESQAADGDSGGAVFVHDGVEWQLAGILFAIGVFSEQPAQTSLHGNLSYAGDLSLYADQILDTVALPEPGTATGLVTGALVLAALRRRGRTGGPGPPA